MTKNDAKRSEIILELAQSRPLIRVADIVERLMERRIHIPSTNALRVMLNRMVKAGLLEHHSHGAYCVPGRSAAPNVEEWVADWLRQTYPRGHSADTLRQRFVRDHGVRLDFDVFDRALVALNGRGLLQTLGRGAYGWAEPPKSEPSIFD